MDIFKMIKGVNTCTLVVALLCLIKSGSGDNFCTGKVSGNYADPDNCGGYIACVHGIVYKMKCAPGNLKWSDSIKRCEWPNKEKPPCKQGSTSQPITTTQQQKPDNFCTGKDTGRYADPDNCHGYIACVHGILYKMPCAPKGLVWSDSLNRCVWPNKEKPPCKQGSTSQPSTTQSQTTASQEQTPQQTKAQESTSQLVTSTPQITTTTRPDLFCSDKSNGDYPDTGNCNGFITCANGIKHQRVCPDKRLVWNDFIKRCDWPQNVVGDCAAKLGCVDRVNATYCGAVKARRECKDAVGWECCASCKIC